jgi:hypothetical protein
MESGLVEVQLGRIEHASGMWEQGMHTLQLALENFEALRGTEPVATHQRRIDSTHFAMCRAWEEERNYLRAESECKAAIGEAEIRAARHPQNRYLQESLAKREFDTASVLANSGHADEARRRAELGLKAVEQDTALPQTPSYALDFAAQRLLTVMPTELRNPALAATYAARAADVTAGQVPAYLVTLAMAQQACGRSEDAVRTARQAIASERHVLHTIAPLFGSWNRPEVSRMFLQANERLSQDVILIDRITDRLSSVAAQDRLFGVSVRMLLDKLGLQDADALGSYYFLQSGRTSSYEQVLSMVRGQVIHEGHLGEMDRSLLRSWFEFARHLHDLCRRIVFSEVGYSGTYFPSTSTWWAPRPVGWVKAGTSPTELGLSSDSLMSTPRSERL